ncbi:FAD-dependent thymidylate synthase [Candidatus Woesearchaeota archaeon]|nr:FAD-dependent thymidylate synthase [Candidatus Woesearchaeota archaeon]
MEVKMIADSKSEWGDRICTLQLKYPRFIHAEFMTHRVFSRSASSSRAIPISKIISQVWNDPAMPVHWGANVSGMQAKTELTEWKLSAAKFIWRTSAKFACGFAYLFSKIGLHKQIGNRILEPWQYINVIVTSTEWDNFFELRVHPDAQPEIQELARAMFRCINHSTPQFIEHGDWHLPYITSEEKIIYSQEELLKASTARCARVSYSNHDGSKPNITKDIDLHDKLVASRPIHASPAEHQATPGGYDMWHKNFRGWVQYREYVEQKIYKQEGEIKNES